MIRIKIKLIIKVKSYWKTKYRGNKLQITKNYKNKYYRIYTK